MKRLLILLCLLFSPILFAEATSDTLGGSVTTGAIDTSHDGAATAQNPGKIVPGKWLNWINANIVNIYALFSGSAPLTKDAANNLLSNIFTNATNPVPNATTAGTCTGNAASATTAAACTGNSATASALTGTLGIAGGGSGKTTANDALNAFLPTQTGNNTKVLQTDGTNTSWQAAAGGTTAFGGLTTTPSTNTTSAMHVGTGASLDATGTGTIVATSCSGNSATATTAGACSGNAASATTAAACSGNAATATTAATCSGNAATATSATSAASLSIAGQTGLLSYTGLASTNRVKTIRDAADTILELGGGSYKPTGTWDWTGGTITWPTFNQATTGAAGSVTAATGGTSLFTGPTAARTFTLPDSDQTLLYSGGALGTPGSGTVTNLTGTASININGTVGATTPAAGKFTTLWSDVGVISSSGSGLLAIGDGATTTGYLMLHTATANKGGLELYATNNAGNTTTSVTNASHGQADTISIPDPGTTMANFVLDQANQTIYGVKTFNSTITGSVSGSAGSAGTATTATNATNSAITNNAISSASWYPTFVSANTGNLPLTVTSTALSFVPSTGVLTATGFSGPLTGAVTGNCSGSSGSCTGNAATVTGFSPTSGKTLTVQKSMTMTAADDTGVYTFPTGTVTLPANNQTMYIGSTAHTINRTTGTEALTGISSIDGTAAGFTTSPTQYALLYGSGSAGYPSALGLPATTGTMLQGATAGAPTWTATPSLGASGTAGSMTIYPQTASSGTLVISATNQTGAFNTTITNAAHGQSDTISVPDSATTAANFVLSVGTGSAIIPTQVGVTTGYVLATSGGATPTLSWAAGGGGGAPAFSAITSGSNTTAAMTVGTGASLAPTGTGTISATSVTGTQYGSFSVNWPSPNAGAAIANWLVPTGGIHVTNLTITCCGGTSITGYVDVITNLNADSGALGSAGDVTATAGASPTSTGAINVTVAAGNFLNWRTTSISGSPTAVIVSISYTNP